MLKSRRIIIDCDPGHDDAIALLLAFSTDHLKVEGVTVSAGNQTLEKTVQNAKNVLNFAKITVPVCAGMNKPLLRELEIAPSVHGESGLDGPVLEQSTQKTHELNAIEFMRVKALESTEKLTIVATGPLTNVGAFLMTYPELKDRIEEIVIMGGSIVGGNWSASAEFNILVDPEAASIVFNSGIHVVMAGLDVTHQALIYPENIETIRSLQSPVAVLVAELLDFFILFHQQHGFTGAPLHDPCAVLYLMNPDMFEKQEALVNIEVDGEYTTGATVADFVCRKDQKKNTTVLLGIDQKAFFAVIYDAMKRYQERGL